MELELRGHWTRRPSESSPSTVVVFIHGVLSSSETCWLHENGTFWPNLLESEKDFSKFGIYEFTYHTGIFSGSYSLGDVVDSLKECLNLDGVNSANRLVFVAHSMGGIVTRRYVVQQIGEFARKGTQIGLFLVASPSLGSNYANWLSPIAKLLGHSQARALKFCEENAWLNDLNSDFRNALGRNEVSIVGKELVEDRFVVVKRLGIFSRVVPTFTGSAFFGEALRVPCSDHFSIAKPADASALQHRLLSKFLADIPEAESSGRRVTESKGVISTRVAGHEIRIIYGEIDQVALDDIEVVALPCNEYFDNLCSGDLRSALGAFVECHFPGRAEEFSNLISNECRQTLGEGQTLQKTASEAAQSFGVGSSILLRNPLGFKHSVALVATTTQRAGQGLSGRVSYLFEGMHNLLSALADARMNRILMPLMGAGHGGISPPQALVGILLALAEASKAGMKVGHPKTVTVVIYQRAGQERPSISPTEVKKALSLLADGT